MSWPYTLFASEETFIKTHPLLKKMNFQSLPTIPTAQDLLDTAFGRAKKRGAVLLSSTNRKTDKTLLKKKIAHEKIIAVKDHLTKEFKRIIDAYPDFAGLPEFYEQLCATQMDLDAVRQALGRLQGSIKSINEQAKAAQATIRKTHTTTDAKNAINTFYGRLSSLLKRLDKPLSTIEKARRTLTTFPAIKTDCYTIAIAGFPNVGKSTLLAKLTPAKPKIAAYAFTTKTLNVGYYKEGHEKVQVVDTPGTLARFEKMNAIEQQAHLCLKYVADIIVLVYDPTDEKARTDQLRLLKGLKEHDKPTIIYLSKTDICSEGRLAEAQHLLGETVTTIAGLKEAIATQRQEN